MNDAHVHIILVFVQMDHYEGTSVDRNIPNLVPFVPLRSFTAIDDNYRRFQYPFEMGTAKTVHSSQGVTGTLNFKYNFTSCLRKCNAYIYGIF